MLQTTCDKRIKEAEDLIDGTFTKDLLDTYQRIYARFEKAEAEDRPKHKIIHQLYPKFFNEATDWCDDESMAYGKVNLDRDVRTRLNNLVDKLAKKIKEVILIFNIENNFRDDPLIRIVEDYDSIYDGHRFCEQRQAEDRSFDDEDIWFHIPFSDNTEPEITGLELLKMYDPETCQKDSRYDTDLLFLWHCDAARLAAIDDADEDFKAMTHPPHALAQTFHPKAIAHDEVAESNFNFISYMKNSGDINIESSLQRVAGGFMKCSTSPNKTDSETMEKIINQYCLVPPIQVEKEIDGNHVLFAMTGCGSNPPLKEAVNLCREGLTEILNYCKLIFFFSGLRLDVTLYIIPSNKKERTFNTNIYLDRPKRWSIFQELPYMAY